MSGYPPQKAWSVAYSETRVQNCSDSSFAKIRGEIIERAKILDKSLRVKITAWIAKLSEETRNEIWKKNRNAYTKLLLEQLKCGRLEEPFNHSPPAGPLPTLHKALLYPYTKPSSANSNVSNNNVSRTTLPKMQMSPSQQLDSYLSYYEKDTAASPTAPASSLSPRPTSFDGLDSLNTPTSRMAPDGMISNAGYHLNTAVSHVKDEVGEHLSGGGGAVDAVELRLSDAEERLQQHSTLLSLFLDISSADCQLQQLELKEDEEKQAARAASRQQRQQQRQKSVAQVLEIAERKLGNSSRPLSPKHFRDENISSTSSKEENNTFSFSNALPAVKNREITEEALLQKLARFDEKTANLKAKMATIITHPYQSASFSFKNGQSTTVVGGKSGLGAPTAEKKAEGRMLSTSYPFPKKSKPATFIPSRHTLKSAAAALATRKSIERDTENTENSQDDGGGGVGGDLVVKADLKKNLNLHKAAALLKPHPDSTTALISEVAALRKRVANSLVCIEESHHLNSNNDYNFQNSFVSLSSSFTPSEG